MRPGRMLHAGDQKRSDIAFVEDCLLPCAMTSLGEYGKQMVRFIHIAASHLKSRNQAPRDDGASAASLTARFRFSLRAEIQAAILKGNGMLASFVGL